jgi:putative Mg2+ transporter-C (MgtC) family protein
MAIVPLDWHLLGSTTLRLAVAYLLALPTGWWTEREGHAVGIRTFPIVALASCGFLMIMQGSGSRSDDMAATSRVLQGLTTGIGFVGGGAIVKEGLSVHGTAVAASIWNFGAIGAAVAMERYEIAIVLAVLNLLTMRLLVPIKKRLDESAS